ncbi:hypothetical protein R6Q59_025409 [Mikania micrantha]
MVGSGLSAGVDFPPTEENSVPLFTSPQTHPVVHPTSPYEDAAIQASLQTDASGLSLSEIANAEGIADVLMDMLNALDPKNHEGLKEELIVDLVDQCRSYQQRVMTLVNTTSYEKLLGKGLTLNDTLMRVLRRHDDISKGGDPTQPVVTTTSESSVAPLVNVTREDDESEDDFGQLVHRGQNRNQNATRTEPQRLAPILPPPPASKAPISSESTTMVDYLSGDTYASKPSQPPKPSSPPPCSDDYINPTATLFAAEPTNATIPPPPSKHSQRQHFFDQNQTSHSGSGSGSGSSYDSLVGQTQNLSLNPSTKRAVKDKPEDELFKDLVDFAKAKSSSPSSSYPNRSF